MREALRVSKFLELVATPATPVWTCYSSYKPRSAQSLRVSYKFSPSE